MKAQTKTFRRLVRKCLVKSGNISAKKARSVLSSNQQLVKSIHHGYVNHGKVWVLSAYGIKSKPSLQLPPSMPKSSAAKIASYEDTRHCDGVITILLKDNFIFPFNDSSVIEVHNVKEAIAIMRTVVAV